MIAVTLHTEAKQYVFSIFIIFLASLLQGLVYKAMHLVALLQVSLIASHNLLNKFDVLLII